MIVDIHAHAAGRLSSAQSIRETAAKCNIEKICLCTGPKNNLQLGPPPSMPLPKRPNSNYLLNRMLRFAYRRFLKDMGDGNSFVAELSQAVPDTIIPFLWVNPLDPKHLQDMTSNLERLRAKGIKLHQAWDAFSFDGSQFKTVAEIARPRSLPIFCHVYSRTQARKLLRFLLANRDVVFIVGHLAGLDVFKEYAAKLPNVYFDTSGSERIRVQDIQHAIDWFGCEHVLFGSDTPYAQIEVEVQKVDQLRISDDHKDRIFKTNALEVLSRVTAST